jgi:hypothetical protein
VNITDRAIVRLALRHDLLGGEHMVHTFHVAGALVGTSWTALAAPLSVQDAATKAADAWNNNLGAQAAAWATSTTFRGCTATLLDSAGRAAEVAESVPTVLSSGSGTGVLPTEVAAACSLRTARAGRSYRGRVFLGGFSSNVVNSATGRIHATYLAQAHGVVLSFLRAMRTAGYTPVVLSTTRSEATPVTAVDMGDVFDVQRRRRNGLGEVRTRTAL